MTERSLPGGHTTATVLSGISERYHIQPLRRNSPNPLVGFDSRDRRRFDSRHARDIRAEIRRKESHYLRRRAGRIVKELRKSISSEPIPADEFGAAMGTGALSIMGFESGADSILMSNVYAVAKTYFSNDADIMGDDIRDKMHELRTTKNYVDEEKLMGVLVQDGMNLGRSITFLRLLELERQFDFSERAGINYANMSRYERGVDKPSNFNLNEIFDAAGIARDSMPAQYIRLSRDYIAPMTLDELRTCSFGQLMKYLYSLTGTTRMEMAKNLNYTPPSLIRFEKKPSLVSDRTLEDLFFLLNIHQESPLAQILHTKVRTPDVAIADDLLEGMLTQDFLLQDQLDGIRMPRLSKSDKELLLEMRDLTTIQEVMDTLMKHKGLILPDLVRRTNMPYTTIYDIATDIHHPTDYNIARTLLGLGYSIFHPITQYVLRFSEQLKTYESYDDNIIFPRENLDK
jgi:transcriptional regulator with XRE-family HTH domain